MKDLIHINISDAAKKHRSEHEKYEYFRKSLIPPGENGCIISVFEIPPGKSAYPYHYHAKNEEAFYIISGTGLLKTYEGSKNVEGGDFLFFPSGEKGAHKLTNTSEDQMLVYIDFSTYNDLEAAVYPDSDKIGIWGKDINKLFDIKKDSEYYDGE